jgi:hypothetical protein
MLKKSPRSLCATIALSISVFTAGCASVSVVSWEEVRSLRPTDKHSRPSLKVGKITSIADLIEGEKGGTLVLDPSSGHVKLGASGGAGGGGRNLGQVIDQSLLKTWEASRGSEKTKERVFGGLLVTGQIWKESPGSRLFRTVVGLGAGRSRMEGRFYVYNLDKSPDKPWLKIHTSGGSNREPGVMWTFVPGPYAAANIVGLAGAAATAGMRTPQGLTGDAKRTGRTLAEFIGDRMSRKRFFREHKAKLSGHYSLPVFGSGRVPLANTRHHPTETLYLE